MHSDDGGAGYNSRMFFSAGRYGDHYIAADPGSNRTGTYKLLVDEVRTDDYPDGVLLPGTVNDDGGSGLNSRLEFEAPYTGAYYIAAGAYEDYTGDYTLGIMEVV